MDVVNGERPHGPHAGLALANEHQADNIEDLMPVMAQHFIDAKVRHGSTDAGHEWYENVFKTSL